MNGNGLLEDVYNFNVELEDTVRCEPDNGKIFNSFRTYLNLNKI